MFTEVKVEAAVAKDDADSPSDPGYTIDTLLLSTTPPPTTTTTTTTTTTSPDLCALRRTQPGRTGYEGDVDTCCSRDYRRNDETRRGPRICRYVQSTLIVPEWPLNLLFVKTHLQWAKATSLAISSKETQLAIVFTACTRSSSGRQCFQSCQSVHWSGCGHRGTHVTNTTALFKLVYAWESPLEPQPPSHIGIPRPV